MAYSGRWVSVASPKRGVRGAIPKDFNQGQGYLSLPESCIWERRSLGRVLRQDWFGRPSKRQARVVRVWRTGKMCSRTCCTWRSDMAQVVCSLLADGPSDTALISNPPMVNDF